MSDVLAGALSLLLATNKTALLNTALVERAGITVPMSATNDPVEAEFQVILRLDDQVSDEVERWLDALPDGTEVSAELKARIDGRHEEVRKRYIAFMERNPKHAPSVIAYGSFLGDIGDEFAMADQWEKARAMDPSNPAVWNNLAGHYAHRGPVEKAFPYFEKAIELKPNEAQYWHSLGTVTYLFRRDAEKYYGVDEQGVFKKAFEFYAKATALRPLDFKLASDVAQTWYGVKSAPATNEVVRKAAELAVIESGLGAWTNALRLATLDEEREGVRLHMARWQIKAGRWSDARTHLDAVTNSAHATVKVRLERTWREKQGLPLESK